MEAGLSEVIYSERRKIEVEMLLGAANGATESGEWPREIRRERVAGRGEKPNTEGTELGAQRTRRSQRSPRERVREG